MYGIRTQEYFDRVVHIFIQISYLNKNLHCIPENRPSVLVFEEILFSLNNCVFVPSTSAIKIEQTIETKKANVFEHPV